MQISSTVKPADQRLRLPYLDGLRGLAALYVVLVHVGIDASVAEQLPQWMLFLMRTLRYGAFSVVIFVVLSGYVLMLPVVRSQTGYVSGGLWNFIKRRSRRILPPYYAALLLCLLIAVAIFACEKVTGFQWPRKEPFLYSPYFSWFDFATHLLLIHNLSGETFRAINAPMWSVGTEWQLYFFFPLFLLPIWRRYGLTAVVIVALITGLAPLYLFNRLLESAHPWFLGLFTLGMAAADIGFSQKPLLVSMRKSLPWGTLAIVFTIIAFVTEWRNLGLEVWIGQVFLGVAVACFFINYTKSVTEGKKPPLLFQLFDHPWMIALGTFSYSLYLTHGPIVALIGQFLSQMQLSATTFTVTYFFLSVVLSLIFAYLFYLIFERAFMSHFLKQRKVKDVIK